MRVVIHYHPYIYIGINGHYIPCIANCEIRKNLKEYGEIGIKID
jgi:hypothetical protein